jgi:hypothetical protein
MVTQALKAPLTAGLNCRVLKIDGSLLRRFRRNLHIHAVRPIKDHLAILSGDFGWFVVQLVVHAAGNEEIEAEFHPLCPPASGPMIGALRSAIGR